MYNAEKYRVPGSRGKPSFSASSRHEVRQAPRTAVHPTKKPVQVKSAKNPNLHVYRSPQVQSSRNLTQAKSSHRKSMKAEDPHGNEGCTSNLRGNVPDPQHSGKILICHVPPGDPSNPQTLSIDPNALNGHKNDLDYDGPCVPKCPSPGNSDYAVPNCNGTCGDDWVKNCAGICVNVNDPPTHEVDCKGVCYKISDGPPNVPNCFGECRPRDNPGASRDCAGVCICDNALPSHVINCNGDCVDRDDPKYYRSCDGQCITIPCNSVGAKNDVPTRIVRTAQPSIQVKAAIQRKKFSPKNE